MSGLSAIDIAALIPITYLALMGFRKGLLVELFSLIGLLVGALLCSSLTQRLINSISGFSSVHPLVPLVLYIVVFLLLFIVIVQFGKLLERILKLSQLNIFNRFAGLVFGVCKGIFLVSLIIWLGTISGLIPKSALSASLSGDVLQEAAPQVLSLLNDILPVAEDVVHDIQAYFESILKAVS